MAKVAIFGVEENKELRDQGTGMVLNVDVDIPKDRAEIVCGGL